MVRLFPRPAPAPRVGDRRKLSWPQRRTAFFVLGGLVLSPVLRGAATTPVPPQDQDTAATGQRPLLPWHGLSVPAANLGAAHHAARIESDDDRRAALEEIADDPAFSARARAVASFRLGSAALRRGRWTAAVRRLSAPEFAEASLAGDALLLAGESLPGARGDEAIALLERLLLELPDHPRRTEAQLALGRRLLRKGKREAALRHFETAEGQAPFEVRGRALAEAATALERLGRSEDAARALETLYYDMPTHRQSLPAGQKLSKLYQRPEVASPSPAKRYPAAMRRAAGFARAGNHGKAHQNYLEVARRFASAGDPEFVRLRIGVEEFHRGRLSASLRTLGRIQRADLRPEALYYRGESLRRLDRLTTQSRILEELLALEQDHDFGGRALYSLARARLARNDRVAALPYLQRLAEAHPNDPRGLFARWHVLWDRYRNGRLEGTAVAFERAARENPGEFMAGQFLYFGARAAERSGDAGVAADLYREVFIGYQNSFYGRRAAERLREIGAPDALRNPLPEPGLLLRGLRIERTAEGARIEELHAAGFPARALAAAQAAARAGLPDDPAFEAIAGWLLAQENRNVRAIQALRRAAPFFTSAAGEALPPAWWRLLYPLRYEERLREQSARWNLEPFLVAGLIRQESVFAPRTRSPVGARGLMQIMPATGRALARLEGLTYRVSRLYDPAVNIRFGTRYFRQLLDEFDNRPELALAGYNAGPHRVRAWTAEDRNVPAELFIEEIPFTETRNYVKLVMRNEMLYRRWYPELAEETAAR